MIILWGFAPNPTRTSPLTHYRKTYVFRGIKFNYVQHWILVGEKRSFSVKALKEIKRGNFLESSLFIIIKSQTQGSFAHLRHQILEYTNLKSKVSLGTFVFSAITSRKPVFGLAASPPITALSPLFRRLPLWHRPTCWRVPRRYAPYLS